MMFSGSSVSAREVTDALREYVGNDLRDYGVERALKRCLDGRRGDAARALVAGLDLRWCVADDRLNEAVHDRLRAGVPFARAQPASQLALVNLRAE
jgi:hypothetical protein